ncbi:IMPACT family protein [Limnovirga soli]|uniref:YigZ family protein n=1 Tax=Limnovirga soli TaxID=2656915 RepID=A0A8J8FAT6_9BACT|nr:YigZ family protein [Limnovirga soli]NNV54645.1 YigZ family protein [Limnovirga soli]
MSEQDFYQTIAQNGQAEFKDRGSRFIAYTFPIQHTDDFKNCLQQLKKEHPKAVHHCFAYRLGVDGNSFRVSDDGEPSGTAGKPILGQIDSKGLTNLLIVVVRYFGGTLLGVPGLINAYKTAASMALQMVPTMQKPVTVRWQITFGYTQMNEVMRWVKALNCTIAEQEMQLFCKLILDVPRNRMEELKTLLSDMREVEITTLKNA